MSNLIDDPNASYNEGFKLIKLPTDLSEYEVGFAIDCNVISPQFYLVHQNLGLEKVVTDESSGIALSRCGEQVPTAMVLAQFWLRKNGVTKPPRKIHIRTDYESLRGPYGAVHTFEFNAERRSYIPSQTDDAIPRTTLSLN